MVLDFSKASKQQLFTILSEVCPVDFKYRAAFELQKRKEQENNRKVSHFKRLASFSDKSYRFNS
jgi:hypothetical protein